jgi:hypothetical protein
MTDRTDRLTTGLPAVEGLPMFSDLPIRRAWISGICAMLVIAGGLGLSAYAETTAEGRPFAVECYYRARWGHADEFIRLYRKNHLPVLKKSIEKGRILKLSAVRPRYHATEDSRWDFRVTIVFKDALVAHDPSMEEEFKKQIFTDQEAFKKEEQRRFEMLEAHWDVPVEDFALDE